ncbi:MAG: EAL domain-containing protein [Burkholderiaceae bacterium]|nr:EAL domain-containing protein [Burkholderiaceae bacterium]
MKHRPPGYIALALVIDDDPFIRLLARDALEKSGLRVAEAGDGATGLAAIAALAPDIILLDVMMPVMDGFEVCRQICRLPDAQLTPILMLTALDDADSIDRAYDAGATDFISKPIQWQILGHRVRYMLKASALLRNVTESDLQLAKAQRMTSVGSWQWHVGSDRTDWSDEMYRICGVRAGSVDQSLCGFLGLVHPADRKRVEAAVRAALEGGDDYDLEHRLLRPDGGERIVHGKADVVYDANRRPVSMSGMLQDITLRKQAERRITQLANYDALTDLPNRALLNDRITQAITLLKRAGPPLTILCLDLDGFKFVNDSFGHAVGDTLLKMVAGRLRGAIRECDSVARLGGDEFALILLGLADSGAMAAMAQKILELFAEPFVVDAHQLHVSASIGISVFPNDGDSSDALLKNADAAMYSAKEKGRDCFQFYAQEMSARAEQRVTLENALRGALEGGQFELYYQPKVDLRSGRIGGVEALLRWHRPRHGMMPPDSFIGLAEATGLIVPIGAWVLRSACLQAKKWHDMGFHDLTVAVNLSARQFGKQDIAQLVREALAESGLAARHLELELTESVLMSDSDAMLAALRDIKQVGVTLTLDDFGTGYSSLSYLKRFPIDVLKIDRSFINNVTTDADDASLTKSIILLAQSLKMKTVAEGVETAAQLGFLVKHHCDVVQGYYFSRPVGAEALSALLADSRSAPLMTPTAASERGVLLLVDDDPNIRLALARLLRPDGYQILQAANAAEGFDLLATHQVRVIVCDQRMPGMSGTDFLGQVKQIYPDTIRIVLSGYAELASVIEAINRGAVYRFLTKPWDEQLLRDQLRDAFEQHRLIYGEPARDAPPPRLSMAQRPRQR